MSLQVGRNSCWKKNFCLEHRFGINGHDIFPETACRPKHAKQVGPQNSFVLASQDIFKIIFGQSIESACLYAITMQERKDMREKNIQPKIYGDMKIEIK